MLRTRMTGTAAAVLLVMAIVGCSSTKKDPMATNSSVTDISAVPPAPVIVEAPLPEPVAQPVVSDVPTQAPAAPAATGGGKYTVQKGDTLWKIATASYGDGKQWQRIASANPGLSPATLQAGQKITIP